MNGRIPRSCAADRQTAARLRLSLLLSLSTPIGIGTADELAPPRLIETVVARLADTIAERRSELGSDRAALRQVVDQLLRPHSTCAEPAG